jgi:GTP cyclohydrolase II
MTVPVSPAALLPEASTLDARVRDLRERAERLPILDRPLITLTFAQSLDGSIASGPDVTTDISNDSSRRFTHMLRAQHDAILVGINTVLVDDPSLTVRLVEGESPRSVVLDSRLRCPPTARVLREGCDDPIIATTSAGTQGAARALRAAGADVLHGPSDSTGRVDLPALLSHLRRAGIRSLMVEGGAEVITSVLRAQVADQLILTIAPRFLGGLRAVHGATGAEPFPMPQVDDLRCDTLGSDLVVTASLSTATA